MQGFHGTVKQPESTQAEVIAGHSIASDIIPVVNVREGYEEAAVASGICSPYLDVALPSGGVA